jgi:hypothetical protein
MQLFKKSLFIIFRLVVGPMSRWLIIYVGNQDVEEELMRLAFQIV